MPFKLTTLLRVLAMSLFLFLEVQGRSGGRRLLQDGTCVPVTDVIQSRGDVTIFSAALENVGLDETLDSPAGLPVNQGSKGSYTVLVPTDAAFLEYLNDAGLQLEALTTTSRDELEAILKSHIITGEALKISDFETGKEYVTLNDGKSLVLKSSIEAIVKEADLEACGAEVHIIDFVVSPDILVDGGAPELSPSPDILIDGGTQELSPSPDILIDGGTQELSPSPVKVPAPSPEKVPEPSPSPPPEKDSPLDLLTGESPSPSPAPIPSQSPSVVSSPVGDLLPIGQVPNQSPPALFSPSPANSMMPITPSPSSGTSCTTASSLLGSGGDTTLFYSIVKSLGLESWLQQTANSPYTVFVPTDEAFLSSGIDLESLAKSKPEILSQIVRNHIITGQALRQGDFKIGSTYKTMNEGQLLRLDTSIAPIMQRADIQACASMIHIINKVLVPDFVDLSAITASTGSTTSTASGGSWSHGQHSQGSSASTAQSGSSAGTTLDATYINAGGLTAVQASTNRGSLDVKAISFSG